jgi:putative membrane protein
MMLMMVWWVLVWGAIVFGIVWLARGSFDVWRRDRRETPVETLERRFAEGEISIDDYYDRRAVITSGDYSAGEWQPRVSPRRA